MTEEAISTRVWTVPNVLSLFRIALVPVLVILVLDDQFTAALAVLILSSLSDYLDGYIARRFHQISRLGQLLDPAADRFYIFAALIALSIVELLPWWLVGIVLARDVLLGILGIILANYGYGPLPVHHLGKVATFCLFYALPLMMLGYAFPEIAFVSEPIAWAFALWGAFLYWWAGAIYLLETFRVIRIPLAETPNTSSTL